MVCPMGLTYLQSGYVLVAIAIAVLPIAAITFARSGAAWRSIGRGPYAIDPDLPPSRIPRARQAFDPLGGLDPHSQSDSQVVREEEVRQMVEAKSYRRVRRGEEPLDVEAETERQIADLIGLER
jgi:hypothetical protein